MSVPTFAELGLGPRLVRFTESRGYSRPTPVQAAVIPAVLAGRDVWACAQTGSGKTAAFVLPLLERSRGWDERPRRLAVLVLVPTRELALQIGEVFASATADAEEKPRVRVLVGGVAINPQMLELRGGAHVVVATPGRLLDLVDKNALTLGAVRSVVLDEADRLLDGGFGDEVGRVLSLVPASRQTLLFSATFPSGVHGLAARMLRDPVRVDVAAATESTPDIRHRAIEVDKPRRTPLLRSLLGQMAPERVIVFVATTYSTEHVAEKLRTTGFRAAALHGQLSQSGRIRVLTAFREGKSQVLVATDVAARGLDVSGLPLVVNYDLPRSPADYTHRVGRTGRAGLSGEAISFVTGENDAHFRLIEKRNGLALERETIEGFERTEPVQAPFDPAGGLKGKRKSKKDKLREAAAKVNERE